MKIKRFLILFLLATAGFVLLAKIFLILTDKKFALIGDRFFVLEIADTASEQIKGLGGRDSLRGSTGMLFVFEAAATHSFWMEEMNFNLDFLWLRNDVVIETTEDVPSPRALDGAVIRITPKESVDGVVEIGAGAINKYNINKGDRLRFLL